MAGDDEQFPSRSSAGRFHPPRGIAGEDLGRILSLSDGVFAFAMTLLALSLVVPVVHGSSSSAESGNLLNRLGGELPVFFGYVFAFVMIAIWWIVHNRTFQYIARYDSALVWINMAILLQVAVMPFVMTLYNDYSNTQLAIDLFAFIQVGLGISTVGLWDYARRAKLIKPNVPPEVALFFSRRGWITSAIFLASIGVSFINLTAAQLTWVATFVVQRLLDRTSP
jgi:uncharacterized membrane protein